MPRTHTDRGSLGQLQPESVECLHVKVGFQCIKIWNFRFDSSPIYSSTLEIQSRKSHLTQKDKQTIF
jgi:hypothetical protein